MHGAYEELDNTDLLFLPGKSSPTRDLTVTFDNSIMFSGIDCTFCILVVLGLYPLARMHLL